ncbi:MAG: hypothetical protein ACHQUB_01265 [Candidatus Saccharimonadia bacterium]
MKKIRLLICLYVIFVPALMFADSTSSIITNSACQANPQALGCNGQAAVGAGSIFNNGINVFIGVIAAISVIMVVIGGLRYVLSGGDAAGVRSAKDTILYALIGLGISIIAFGIVNFVISKLG